MTPARTRLRGEALTLAPLLVVTAFAALYVARHDVGVRTTAVVGVVLLLTQVLPGALVWRAMRPRDGWLLEDLAMGGAVGAALAVPGVIISVLLQSALPQALVLWVWPWLVVAALLAVPSVRRRVRSAEWQALPWWWGIAPAVTILIVVGRAAKYFTQALPGTVHWANAYIDLPYHQALAAEVSSRFPPHTPQVASEPLQYHWFSHAWQGQIWLSSGADLWVVMVRLVPIIVAVLLPLVLAFLGTRATQRVGAGSVVALVSCLLGVLPLRGEWMTVGRLLVYPASMSMGFSLLVGGALLTLLVLRWRGQAPAATVVAVPFLAAIAGGGKGSWLPVVVVGAILAAVAALLGRHPQRRRVWIDAVLMGAVLVALLVFLFAGNEGGMRKTPFTSLGRSTAPLFAAVGVQGPSTALILVVTLFALACSLGPYLGVLGVVADREGRRDPFLWLLVGGVAAAIGAVLVFSHHGSSQYYFWAAGAPLAALAATWGLWLFAERVGAWWVPVVGLVVGFLLVGPFLDHLPGATGARTLGGSAEMVVTLLVVLVVVGAVVAAVLNRRTPGSGAAGFLTVLLVVVLAGIAGGGTTTGIDRLKTGYDHTVVPAGPKMNGSVSSGMVAAARYIADHAEVDDLVMTNRHCRRSVFNETCNHRDFWLPALSGQRVLVGGWAYTRKANEGNPDSPTNTPFWDPALLQLNDGFLLHPTKAAQRKLWDLGVRWLYVDTHIKHADDFGDMARRVLENRTAEVLRLQDPAGSR